MIESMADTDHDDDWATPHVKKAIKIESRIWMVVGVVVIVLVIVAALR